jgi:hypothetical protein
VDGKQLKIKSNTNCNRILSYSIIPNETLNITAYWNKGHQKGMRHQLARAGCAYPLIGPETA